MFNLNLLWIFLIIFINYVCTHGDINNGKTDENFREMTHDTDHIKEHYDGIADFDSSKMTEDELEFHYFQLHDMDNNTKLDGLEMFKAMSHVGFDDLSFLGEEKETDEIDTGKTQEQIKKERKDKKFKMIEGMVDKILLEDDFNKDGYITYWEFVLARKHAEINEKNESKKAT